MVKAALKRPEDEEKEKFKPIIIPVKKEIPTWKKIAGYAVGAVLSPFIAIGMITGCGDDRFLVTPKEEHQEIPKEGLVWLPAFKIMKRENGGFEIEDVSLGLFPSQTKYDGLRNTYSSPEKIPGKVRANLRKYMEEQVVPSIENSLNLGNPAVIEILENNVYLISQPTEEEETSLSGAAGQYTRAEAFKIYDTHGYEIAACDEACSEYNILYYKKKEEISSEVVVHEILHDIYSTALSAQSRREFQDALSSLLYAGGVDEEFEKHLDHHSAMSLVYDFVIERYTRLTSDEKKELTSALIFFSWLRFKRFDIEIPKHYQEKYKEEGIDLKDQREQYLKREAYPYMFWAGLPNAFAGVYKSYMNKDLLDKLINNTRYLYSREALKNFMPIAIEFMEYAKQQVGS
ncbi:hypothetical protein J4450_06940 [Candidatus Micrarchaeota archaeon]|nr:hypothetical protein [Candidatus Micrarchaeota archaeon]